MLTPETCSPDTLALWSCLPQFVQDSDVANGCPFLTWLEGPCSLLQATDTLARDQGQYPGWSILMDITRCPTFALPWLGQFVGVRFSSQQSTDAQQRAAIVGEQGFQRGTVAALVAAAAPYVTTTANIVVTERYTGDPYQVLVTIPGSDVPGVSYYYQLNAGYATYADLNAAFANYGDMNSASTANLSAALQAALPAALLLTVVIS